jgi:hypothetical protein
MYFHNFKLSLTLNLKIMKTRLFILNQMGGG